ncbi:MAG: hypothetical protein LBM75_01045 [Myxococcales bacterium]|jgi:hypothetical protein|nr:hypothetical protein [Myxococcales bacterium]
MNAATMLLPMMLLATSLPFETVARAASPSQTTDTLSPPSAASSKKSSLNAPRAGVDADAMAEASASDRQARRVVSSHAYDAFLMALRSRDAGDIKAARHWLRQVLAFDPKATEARQILKALDADAEMNNAR